MKKPRRLEGKRLLGFAFGTMGQMAPIGVFNAYATNYYNYTVGLDPRITFVGMFIGLMVFSLTSPVFGTLIDRKRVGRLGRRRPFLLLGIPLIVVLMIIAWTPPMGPDGRASFWLTGVYFWIICGAVFLNQSLLVVTYLSMIAEQATDEENRIKIAKFQAIFAILGTVISILIPILLQSMLKNPENPSWNTNDGRFLRAIMPGLIGTTFGMLGAISFIIVFLSTDESFLKAESSVGSRTSTLSIKETFEQIFLPFRDKNYRYWLGNAFLFNMSVRILILILIPMLTYVIDLDDAQYVYFFACILPFGAGGYILWSWRIKTSGLKSAYGLSLIFNFAFSMSALFLLIPMPWLLRFGIGVVIMGILISSLVAGYLFPNPIVSILVDNAPAEIRNSVSKYNKALSGSYFGLYIFSYNISQAFANIILASLISDQTKQDPTIITLMLPISGLLVLLSWAFLKKLRISSRV
ncbi:MAG: MFS transporter [Candidatus Helarchaeales archaeon]